MKKTWNVRRTARAAAVCVLAVACCGAAANATITVTGAAADQTTFASLLGTCINGTVTIAANGTMSVAGTGTGLNGCGTIVQAIIADAAVSVTLDLVNKKDDIFVGAFNGTGGTPNISNGHQTIDVDDLQHMSTLTTDVGTAWSAMLHEMSECYDSLKNNHVYEDAHKKGIDNENVSLGAENHKLRDGGTLTPAPPALPPQTTPQGGWFIFIPTHTGQIGWTRYEIEGRFSSTNTPHESMIQLGYLGHLETGPSSIPVPHSPGGGTPLNDVYLAGTAFIPLGGNPVPAMSTWGVIALATLVAGAGIVVVMRRAA